MTVTFLDKAIVAASAALLYAATILHPALPIFVGAILVLAWAIYQKILEDKASGNPPKPKSDDNA